MNYYLICFIILMLCFNSIKTVLLLTIVHLKCTIQSVLQVVCIGPDSNHCGTLRIFCGANS
jgi:hypothetical protein